MSRKVTLEDEGATEEFGTELARELGPGSVLALVGELGAGKTRLTQSIVRALGGGNGVTSPTFSLVQEYREGRVPVFHFDFYRMESVDEVIAVGWDDYLDEGGLIIVEWADKFPALFGEETVWWAIEKEAEHRVAKAGRV
ncbi:MAG: tRNA (adenosine(37)-N6)-threonylcarbamoyltransferase complex ATPase subunit type 1 TsaE [Verrucomicrobiota bacterium]